MGEEAFSWLYADPPEGLVRDDFTEINTAVIRSLHQLFSAGVREKVAINASFLAVNACDVSTDGSTTLKLRDE